MRNLSIFVDFSSNSAVGLTTQGRFGSSVWPLRRRFGPQPTVLMTSCRVSFRLWSRAGYLRADANPGPDGPSPGWSELKNTMKILQVSI